MKESYAVLKATPQLMFFPIVSGIVSLFVSLSFFIPLALSTGALHGGVDAKHLPPTYYVVLFLYYLVSYFVVIFFNSALVSCAHDSLSGIPTTYQKGLQNATKHIGKIFAWAVIAATVGSILRLVAERFGIVGRIVIGLLGMAWTVITYFVVPLIVLEDAAPFAALKKSGLMLKTTWGEQVIAGFSISMAMGVLTLIGLLPLGIGIAAIVGGIYFLAVPMFLLAVIYWICVAILSTTLTGIFNTALYVYASTGAVPQGFSSDYIQGAFAPKPARKIFGR
ncbi:MAG TPA: DUF6159 family protein [Fimbriimonadaceae bacterium]|jgi:hypothetical protein